MLVKQKRNKNGYSFVEKRNKIRYLNTIKRNKNEYTKNNKSIIFNFPYLLSV